MMLLSWWHETFQCCWGQHSRGTSRTVNRAQTKILLVDAVVCKKYYWRSEWWVSIFDRGIQPQHKASSTSICAVCVKHPRVTGWPIRGISRKTGLSSLASFTYSFGSMQFEGRLPNPFILSSLQRHCTLECALNQWSLSTLKTAAPNNYSMGQLQFVFGFKNESHCPKRHDLLVAVAGLGI